MSGRMGTADRLIRIAVGIVALWSGLTHAGVGAGALAYLADAVGVIGLATGLSGLCPLYALLGVRTTRRHV